MLRMPPGSAFFRSRIPVALLLALSLFGCGGGDHPEGTPQEPQNPLLRPAQFQERAPDRFRVQFETSEGSFVVSVHRAWAPIGADRFYNLVRAGYFEDQRIYRVVSGFMAQFGVHGDPFVNYVWRRALILDDPVVQSNIRGRMTFAKAGPNSRAHEIFVSTGNNPGLDSQGFAPFGEVIEGMEVVDAFHAGYGDGPPRGEGPYAAMAHARGNEYLDDEFPNLSRILRATLLPGME
jgi:peptidyl-prolyl cis-trans isomerase A (cyclophilin A)